VAVFSSSYCYTPCFQIIIPNRLAVKGGNIQLYYFYKYDNLPENKLMKLSADLTWRGLIKDHTFKSSSWLDQPKNFYLGIDASDSSLTIGNLAVIMLARRLAEAGWQAILLAGGATSLVGDPGGKDEERELKSHDEIAANIKGVKVQMEQLFGGKEHELVNNLDWLHNLKYLDFLRDVGKHFPMTELMQREFVDIRMGETGSGISYAEFSYSLLQGYDFWWLFKNKQVQMQIGASDQWGNMLSGVALIRKKEQKQAHALSMPLVIDKATGRKFGKSEGGAIWLDARRTSPTQFYQFWINVDDAEVENFLKIYTLLPKPEIEAAMAEHAADPQSRSGQRCLAHEVTELVHGKQQTVFAEKITDYLTGKSPIEDADADTLKEIKPLMTNISVQPGIPVIDALVDTGLAASNSDARRLIQSKAVYVNGDPYDKPHLDSSVFKNGRLILRRGKAYKDSVLVELA
jgi:tyrosyl-tRNA synthetase